MHTHFTIRKVSGNNTGLRSVLEICFRLDAKCTKLCICTVGVNVRFNALSMKGKKMSAFTSVIINHSHHYICFHQLVWSLLHHPISIYKV